MNDALVLCLAAAAGFLFGALFFAGLWWTVRKAHLSKYPALWFPVSLLLRMSISLAGFYYVSGGQVERLLACLIGFLIARFLVIRLTGAIRINLNPAVDEAEHAT